MKQENLGMILGAIGVFAFALTLPATRYLVETLNPIFIGLGRSFFAGIAAALILIVTKQSWPNLRQWLQLAIVALAVCIGFPVMSAIAMQSLPASHGGVVLAILPLATAVMGTVIGKEKPSVSFWAASVLGAALVIGYSIVRSGGLDAGHALGMADMLLFLAVLSAALGYALGGKLAHEVGGWQVICWALVLAAPILAYPTLTMIQPIIGDPSSLAEMGTLSAIGELNTPALLCFLYLTLVSQLIGFFFWYKGLALGGIARVSQLQLLQPFVTLAVSAWLLNEFIDHSTLWFAFAVVAVVAISKRTPIAKPITS